MYARLLPQSTTNAVWVINANVQPQLFAMSLAVGTGGSAIYLPPSGNAADKPNASLMGLPVIVSEHASTVGDLGDVLLCDFPNGYICADKGNIQTDMSIHVQFLQDENTYRFSYRFDGQPALASALTPYKGADSLGHFIALQART